MREYAEDFDLVDLGLDSDPKVEATSDQGSRIVGDYLVGETVGRRVEIDREPVIVSDDIEEVDAPSTSGREAMVDSRAKGKAATLPECVYKSKVGVRPKGKAKAGSSKRREVEEEATEKPEPLPYDQIVGWVSEEQFSRIFRKLNLPSPYLIRSAKESDVLG